LTNWVTLIMAGERPIITSSAARGKGRFHAGVFQKPVSARRRLFHNRHQSLGREGLGQKIEGPPLHGIDRHVNGAITGDDNDHGAGIVRLDPLQDFHSVHFGHFQIEDDDIHRLFTKQLKRRASVPDSSHAVSGFTQRLDASGAHRFVVVRHENIG